MLTRPPRVSYRRPEGLPGSTVCRIRDSEGISGSTIRYGDRLTAELRSDHGDTRLSQQPRLITIHSVLVPVGDISDSSVVAC
jgi:hypothetical protein